ncbi:hypothetical protein [Gracilimonas halophila]|jgi:hypothetical protein|uniref:VWFA domain-containing protein n=1 Tax=Gracilimonas halophila TaxID=1834464 RepID=A0ABW5JGA9_9BACT
MMKPKRLLIILITILVLGNCTTSDEPNPRLSMFVGVDISGSYQNSGHFDNSIEFLSQYIYAHLNGIEELEKPNVLFVSSIGGSNDNEPKTFYPIQTFENRSPAEIEEKLREIFPKETQNRFTDFNAFFEQIALTIRNKNLLLRPVSVVMLSDGIPDVTVNGETDFRSLDFSPLEKLSRNITIRLLYTDATTGRNWQTKVPRRRVKVWTQDANVMTSWNDSTIFIPDQPIEEQDRFISWIEDNVDFGVRARRVD